MKEFQEEYAEKTWCEYQGDKKLQKLMDRTVENILTALIELCGRFLAEQGVAVRVTGTPCGRPGKFLDSPRTNREACLSLPFSGIASPIVILISVGRLSDYLLRREVSSSALRQPC